MQTDFQWLKETATLSLTKNPAWKNKGAFCVWKGSHVGMKEASASSASVIHFAQSPVKRALICYCFVPKCVPVCWWPSVFARAAVSHFVLGNRCLWKAAEKSPPSHECKSPSELPLGMCTIISGHELAYSHRHWQSLPVGIVEMAKAFLTNTLLDFLPLPFSQHKCRTRDYKVNG